MIRVANSDDSAAEDKKTDDWVSDIISRILSEVSEVPCILHGDR